MKYLLHILLLFSSPAFSQSTIQKNTSALVGEIGKNGLVFNLLYDNYFFKKHFGFHIGGGTTIFNRYFELRTATAGFYFLIGKKREFYDLGLDLQYHFAARHGDDVKRFILVDPPDTYEGIYPFIHAGYRCYSDKGIFRIGLAQGIIKREVITGVYIGYGIILNKKVTK